MGANKKDGRMPEERVPEEAKEMLKALASKWEDVTDASALQVIPLKGAMTNEVFQIKWPTKTGELSRKVVVRIYGVGVEVFFDRDSEIRTFEFMSKQGHGPRLLGRFSKGRIEEFIRARTLSASDLRDPEISVLVAAKMREFHGLDMAGQKVVHLWDRLRNWLKVAKDMCSPDEAKAFRLDEFDEEITLLEKELSIDQHIGFCHNDLQCGNIMIDEETKAITIIDYEYASYNPVAFDLANHFCEMTADYHTDTPHVVDYSKYPGLEERERFVHAYLSSSAEKPGDKEVEQFLKDVEKFTLGSHLFWGLWGIISEHVNKIEFEYLEYARQRFEQYWLRKPTLLSSSSGASTANTIVAPPAAATATTIAATSSTPAPAATTTTTATVDATPIPATTTATGVTPAPAATTTNTATADKAPAPAATATTTATTDAAPTVAATTTASAAPTAAATTTATATGATDGGREEEQVKESPASEQVAAPAAEKEEEGLESSPLPPPAAGEEDEKEGGLDRNARSKHQPGVFRRFKRYLGFTNVFKKHGHSKSTGHLPPQHDASPRPA